ncbi:MAG TPA: acyl-CoA dehydrogenase family protein, partial [Actinomycetota bacterium]
MNFDLDADELALQQGIREVCRRFPLGRIRAVEDRGGVDRQMWTDLARAGVFSLRLDESDGGLGLGTTAAALVFEELGRALIPGPLIATHVSSGLVPGAAEGDRVVGFAARAGDAFVIGYLEALDDVLLLDHEGVWRVDPASVAAEPVSRPLDPLAPAHVARDIPRGENLALHRVAARWRMLGNVLAAAQLVGIAAAVTDLSVAYAKERRQFDRPIGSFQA